MLNLIALRGVLAKKNVASHIYNADKMLYQDRSRVVELLLNLENKQIMSNNVEI